MRTKAWVAGGVALLLAACGNEVPTEPDGPVTLGAAIDLTDTVVWRGDAHVVAATAAYDTGPGLPHSIAWITSDSSVLALSEHVDLTVTATGIAVGEAYLIARINDTIWDSVSVTVVDNGVVKWRRGVGAGRLGIDLAVDDEGRVYAADEAGGFTVLSVNGDTLWRGPGCYTTTSPAVTQYGVYQWGNSCVRRLGVDGTVMWEDLGAVSGFDVRQAVQSNGTLVVMGFFRPDSNTLVTAYDLSGTIVWQDTLLEHVNNTGNRGGLAIGPDDAVYVAWYAIGPGNYLTRYAPDGQRTWTIDLPGAPYQTAPAVVGDRVYAPNQAGVSVRDTNGAVIYDRLWQDISDALGATADPSEPTVDAAGNLYAHVRNGTTFSLDPGGNVRWVVDLGYQGLYSPGPTILQGDSVLVLMCGVTPCAIRAETGATVWVGPVLDDPPDFMGGLAVGPDGTLYVKGNEEVVALWHRGQLATTGWPTLGGNRGRSGTAP